MHQERVSTDVHIFTSDLYAQVTAGLIVTPAGCILIDTLPFPSETAGISEFIAQHCRRGLKQIIFTHHHADHTYGAYLFPGIEIVAYVKTRDLLIERAMPALEADKAQTPELEEVEIVLPHVVFKEGDLILHLGGKTVRLIHAPGHTPDSTVVYIEEDKVLFAADNIMPVPVIADGDLQVMIDTLKKLHDLQVENMVQGHGEVILRGEVPVAIDRSIEYLNKIRELVQEAIAEGRPRESLQENSIEDCGLSRIPLNGLVQQLHTANLLALYDQLKP